MTTLNPAEDAAARLATGPVVIRLVDGRIHLTPPTTCPTFAESPWLLRDDLAPVERLLTILLASWGDGYGSTLFYELWGSAGDYDTTARATLRRAALDGPTGAHARTLERSIAERIEGKRKPAA